MNPNRIIESGIGEDVLKSSNLINIQDNSNHFTSWKIEKFENDLAVKEGISYEISEFNATEDDPFGNIFVNAGINAMLTLLAGGGGTAFNNANAYTGVGDSTTAASASQTDLQASSNKLRKAMNASYPTYGTSQQIVFQSDYGSSDANFSWQEFAVFNASSTGTMFNRKVSDQGTKTSGQTWRLSVTITVS